MSSIRNRIKRLENRDEDVERYLMPDGSIITVDAEEVGLIMFASAVAGITGQEVEDSPDIHPATRAVTHGTRVDASGKPL